MASPARPRRSSNGASPLRRSEFLTSPLRHRSSASPKRPLMFDDAAMAGDSEAGSSSTTRINGHPPLLSSALDQVELAPAAKTTKVARSAKSPFQSFQAKFSKSPAKAPRVTSSAAADGRPAETGAIVPRSGPTLDLSHSDDAVAQHATASAAATGSCTAPIDLSNAAGGSGAAATSSDGAHASTASQRPNTPTPPPKPARKLFTSRPVVAKKSICFSTEGVATALDVTPDGEIIVVGFTDGSVRLYEMDSSVPSDRHGYLLGHIDEESSQGSPNVNLRVKISPDGRYVFVGCRQGPRVMMSINLDHYRNEKGAYLLPRITGETIFEGIWPLTGDVFTFLFRRGRRRLPTMPQALFLQWQTSRKLHRLYCAYDVFSLMQYSGCFVQGFADVTTYVPPTDGSKHELQESKANRYRERIVACIVNLRCPY